MQNNRGTTLCRYRWTYCNGKLDATKWPNNNFHFRPVTSLWQCNSNGLDCKARSKIISILPRGEFSQFFIVKFIAGWGHIKVSTIHKAGIHKPEPRTKCRLLWAGKWIPDIRYWLVRTRYECNQRHGSRNRFRFRKRTCIWGQKRSRRRQRRVNYPLINWNFLYLHTITCWHCNKRICNHWLRKMTHFWNFERKKIPPKVSFFFELLNFISNKRVILRKPFGRLSFEQRHMGSTWA